jgi:hypothetical protein
MFFPIGKLTLWAALSVGFDCRSYIFVLKKCIMPYKKVTGQGGGGEKRKLVTLA